MDRLRFSIYSYSIYSQYRAFHTPLHVSNPIVATKHFLCK